MTRSPPDTAALLTPDEMANADRLTIEAGTSGWRLMRNAGRSVAEIVLTRYPQSRRIALLAGPGNNGGDAYVAAAHLAASGRRPLVHSLGDPRSLSGDAAKAAASFDGQIASLADFDPNACDLVIDGLFGAGLSRPIEGEAAEAIALVNGAGRPVIAIDLPSGVSGESGSVLGTAIRADRTITFFLRKPGHLLQPGRDLCGEVKVAEIGITPTVLDTIRPRNFANEAPLWASRLRLPSATGHKYDRGHVGVFSGPATRTGAARLAATAALRAGAGLVSVFAAGSALMVNAAHLTAVMLRRCDGTDDLAEILEDERFNAFVLGPGFGVGKETRDFALAVLAAGRALVLDADGITSFAEESERLFAASRTASQTTCDPFEKGGTRSGPALVLTPHAGEFSRLFPDLSSDTNLSKPERARRAAERSQGIVVLKGSDTVIASPDGRVAIDAAGTPWLATAGSGDVLSGLVAAQLGQGVPAFEAACIAVWMHGRAAELFGPGLIADDLPGRMSAVLAEMTRFSHP